MKLRFTKVEGLGNDFVLLDRFGEGFAGGSLTAELAVTLCDRHFGVGADGVLILAPAQNADAHLEIWNADGSRSEMCGNGLRCAAQQLFARLGRRPLTIATAAGLHHCRPANGELVFVELVGLRVEPPESLTIAGRTVTGRVVSLGNPHFVIFGGKAGGPLDEAPTLGPLIERHPRFAPGRTNVEFCELQGSGLRVRVWERGAGLTLACGTGAGAAAAAAWADGLVPSGPTPVSLPGGTVQVEPLAADRLGLTGPARTVFEGEFELLPRP